MADNNYRSGFSRDPFGRDGAQSAASDPLADLARLIGQGDPYAETRARDSRDSEARDSYGSERFDEDVAGVTDDWPAEESYDPPHADEGYAPHTPPARPSYEDEVPADRYFSGPAAKFNGFHEEDAAYDREESRSPARRSQAYEAPHDEYETGESERRADDTYVTDDYDEELPTARRRSGLVLVMAVFGLAVIGTAGAFAYRTMFGGSVLPTLPPIIKADNGPNKIVPAYGESQANNSGQAGAATTGSTEKLVPREEQPVVIEPPKPAPRVVSTIPIINGEGSLPPGMGTSVASAAPNAPVPNSPWPAPPSFPQPAAGGAAQAAAPVPPAAPAAQPSSEPRKVHTVVIHADQSGGAEAAPAAAAAPAPAHTPAHRAPPPPKAVTAASPQPRTGANAPLSIVPGGQSSGPVPPAPVPQSRQAAPAAPAPTMVASAAPVGAAAPAAAGGGYAVQVTSQRSEGEAQAAFRALQAKYPNQLGGHEPIIRRVDLGAKGTYYRALVGPFASAEQAAGLCSGLKAAGGNCIVQRN